MVCFLAQSDPAWVFAELDEGYEDYWPYQGHGGRNADLEPGCSGYIHFKNGIRAFYNGSKGLTPRTGFELLDREARCVGPVERQPRLVIDDALHR